jgi:hypothetical protein
MSGEYKKAVFSAFNKARSQYMQEHAAKQPKAKSGMPLAPKKGTSGYYAIMALTYELLPSQHKAKFASSHKL